MARPIQILRDTSANLGPLIPRVGMPFYLTDTGEAGVGDGTSTVADLLAARVAGETFAVATTGTSTSAKAPLVRAYTITLAAAAGTGAFTRKLVLPVAGEREGALTLVRVEIAASANPAVEVRNATASGTVLWSQSGDAAQARNYLVILRYTAGAWVRFFQAEELA